MRFDKDWYLTVNLIFLLDQRLIRIIKLNNKDNEQKKHWQDNWQKLNLKKIHRAQRIENG